MQEGAAPVSTERPLFNPAEIRKYDLRYLKKIIPLINDLIDVKEHQLLKLSTDQAAITAFHEAFFNRIMDASPSEGIIGGSKYNQLKDEIKEWLDKNSHALNRNHFLGNLAKQVFDQAMLFNLYDIRVRSCHDLFINELIDIANNPVPTLVDEAYRHKHYDFHDIDPERARNALCVFIAHLINAAQLSEPEDYLLLDAAQTIHNFMHLMIRIAKEGGSMDALQVGAVVGPCLRSALQVEENLFSATEEESRWGNATTQVYLYENGLMNRLFQSVATTSFFDRLFDVQAYKKFYQTSYRPHVEMLNRKCDLSSPFPIAELSRTGVQTATHCLDDIQKYKEQNVEEKKSESIEKEEGSPSSLTSRMRGLTLTSKGTSGEVKTINPLYDNSQKAAGAEVKVLNPLFELQKAAAKEQSEQNATQADTFASQAKQPLSPRRNKSSQGQ